MHVCMCACMCAGVCVCVCVHVCMCACVCVCMCACVHVSVYVYVYVSAYVRASLCVRTCVCACVCALEHTGFASFHIILSVSSSLATPQVKHIVRHLSEIQYCSFLGSSKIELKVKYVSHLELTCCFFLRENSRSGF